MSGALNGADSKIVDFFQKSQLDNHTLSRIWALADVNEDGFLNHFEFVVAMHLIILHIKVRLKNFKCSSKRFFIVYSNLNNKKNFLSKNIYYCRRKTKTKK